MVHVIAVITAKPGQRESILTHFRANVPAVRAEKGCIEYGAAIDLDPALKFQTAFGPDTFVVVEKWERPEDQQAHFDSADMVTMAESCAGLLSGPPMIDLLAPISAHDLL